MSRVVIAGGGTGGHIYPGLAVAKVLKDHGHDVQWVGSVGGLEEKIVFRESFPLHLIRIGKLHQSVGFIVRLKTVFGLPLAFVQAVRLVLRLKPDAVFGVGGFASGPFLFVAWLLRKRTVIWEPNAHAGMANRLLSRVVDECLLVFDDAAKGLNAKKTVRVGLPVRASMKPQPRPSLAGRALRVLVFGGSQGARGINKVVAAWIASDQLSGESIELVHQTGRADFSEVQRQYDDLHSKGLHRGVSCFEYLHDMDARYAWADVIVCRAGASTVAEIAACAKAAIFVPLATAADNHQLKNARVLEAATAAVVIEQKDFSVEALDREIRRFQEQPERIEKFEKSVQQFSSASSAELIARHVLGTEL